MKNDKTLMIEKFLDKGSYVTMINMPKGYGKTSNIRMMSDFFDITKDSKKLFKGTKIMETPYAAEINQYPTVYLSFTNAFGNRVGVINCIKDQFKNEFSRYSFVFDKLDGFKKSRYKHIMRRLENKTSDTLHDIDDSITFLMDCLKKYYNKDVMVFIDDYDIPFIAARIGKFYKDVGNPLYMMFHSAFKTSDGLKYGLLMGTQNVLISDALGGGLNNLAISNIEHNEYGEYFEQHDQELIDENIKFMIKEARNDKWIKTSINYLLKDGNIETEIDLYKSYYENKTNASFWGMLINEGVLKIIGDKLNKVFSCEYIYKLEFANNKVKEQFIEVINGEN